MAESKQKLVVVLGMHRSGTSALTRGLRVLHVDMGDILLPGEEGINDKGYWEDAEINAFNERLLSRLGTAWHELKHLDEGLLTGKDLQDFHEEARLLLGEKIRNLPIFGFKDPRTSILLPFWQPIFNELGFDDCYLITLRNPLDVAKSLEKRDAIPHSQSFLMWAKYTVSALKYSNGKRRAVVSYDDLLEAPEVQLTRISEALELEMMPEHLSAMCEYTGAFLSKDLRHNHYTQAALNSNPEVPPFVCLAYDHLLKASRNQMDLEGPAFSKVWTTIERSYAECIPLNTYIDDLNAKNAQYREEVKKTLVERDSVLSKQAILSENLDIALLARETAVKARDKANQERDKANQERDKANQERDKANQKRDKANQERDAANQARDSHLRALNSKQQELESLRVSLTQQADQLQHHKNELHRILTSNTWRLTRPLRAFRRFFITRPYRAVRHYLSDSIRSVWLRVPISPTQKRRIKSAIFRAIPAPLGRFQAYHNWMEFERQQSNAGMAVTNSRNLVRKSVTDELPSPIPLLDAQSLDNLLVRLIAFYLPQFHPIPENDEWWGVGFTEWTNVRSAQPQFTGHYQPRIPGELGYYDLRDKAVQKRQVELAKLYGVGGFCFYFYWFGGKRLLETPVLNYLNDPSLDLPFCLCWANENWSRRWDGLDSEILIAQEHTAEDDLAFIEHVSCYLRDPRNIRINDRPLLLVYRPSLLPSPKETVERWRDWCREDGIGEIYLAYTQSFEAVDPRKYGFDAAVEFPPNNSGPPVVTGKMEQLNPEFSGTVFDWRIFLERSGDYRQPGYTLFRSVNSSWDNTARRKSGGTIFANSTPEQYEIWLSRAIDDTLEHRDNQSERLIFINAWNEWAEGAYLEPDQRYGYAYLQATRNALGSIAVAKGWRRIVLVGHDAAPHGAQTLLLYLTRMLKEQLHFSVDLVLLGGGPLVVEYEKYASVHRLSSNHKKDTEGKELAGKLFRRGLRHAIANTTVSGHFVTILKQQGFHVVTLIHELPGVIKSFQLETNVKAIAEHSDRIVFPAQQVRDGFERFQPLASEKVVIRPQGLYKKNSHRQAEQIEKVRRELRERFELPQDAVIILGVGYADHRKGIDLFVETAANVCARVESTYFIWVGRFDTRLQTEIDRVIEKYGIVERVIFPGMDFNSDQYYAGSDIYAMTSREDPFPSVVLEALDAGLPVVAFDGAGGFSDLLSRVGSLLVPQFDVAAYADAIVDLATNLERTRQIGEVGRRLVMEEYSFRRYTLDLLAMNANQIRKVSVIVPNYNYARYLHERIGSITGQSYPIWELIVLDDLSTDNSIEVLESILDDMEIDYRLIINQENSGNAFNQWRKGMELATGDYIWIAEADDFAEPEFLERVMTPFQDPDLVISYCESMQIGSTGELLSPDYQAYVADISKEKWYNDYVAEGGEEIRSCLAIKNTIPNVSGVVFRRDVLQEVFNEHFNEIMGYRVAGDWLIYIYSLVKGKLAFTAQSLNRHRRHETSVTLSSFNAKQLKEILKVQQHVRERFILDKAVIAKATSYSQQLYEQFGLASGATPRVTDHPDLKEYLKMTT